METVELLCTFACAAPEDLPFSWHHELLLVRDFVGPGVAGEMIQCSNALYAKALAAAGRLLLLPSDGSTCCRPGLAGQGGCFIGLHPLLHDLSEASGLAGTVGGDEARGPSQSAPDVSPAGVT